EKLTEIHGVLFDYTPRLTQEDLVAFIKIEFGRIGADSKITPREVIRDFIELLDILFQNPGADVKQILGSDGFAFAQTPVEETGGAFEFDI
ncbi:MAG: DUF2791 family P-loop domain-containing protein, partial [Clostridia bacterium]|nr:DUF2791 family P-loop domain-containing protein [Clostridia bacterium]